MRLATTRSLDSAIMAPSLNTASSTISSVGKYLRVRAPAPLAGGGDSDPTLTLSAAG